MELQEISIDKIKPELAPESGIQQKSLFLRGQRQPIRIRPISNGDGYAFAVVDGRRRLANLAARGEKTVLALIDYDLDETQARLDALTLNSGTRNPMDEAEHVRYLKNLGLTERQIAEQVGFSEPKVNYLSKLFLLLPEFQTAIKRGELKISGALKLAKLPKPVQEEFLQSEVKLTVKNCELAEKKYRDSTVVQKLDFEFEETPFIPKILSIVLSDREVNELLGGEQKQIEWEGKKLVLFLEESNE